MTDLKKGATVSYHGVEFKIIDLDEEGRMDNHISMTQNIGVKVYLERTFNYGTEESDGK